MEENKNNQPSKPDMDEKITPETEGVNQSTNAELDAENIPKTDEEIQAEVKAELEALKKEHIESGKLKDEVEKVEGVEPKSPVEPQKMVASEPLEPKPEETLEQKVELEPKLEVPVDPEPKINPVEPETIVASEPELPEIEPEIVQKTEKVVESKITEAIPLNTSKKKVEPKKPLEQKPFVPAEPTDPTKPTVKEIQEKNKPTYRKLVKWMWGLAILGVIGIAGLFFALSFSNLPTFEELENPQSKLATNLYASNGEVLGRYFIENRADFLPAYPSV